MKLTSLVPVVLAACMLGCEDSDSSGTKTSAENFRFHIDSTITSVNQAGIPGIPYIITSDGHWLTHARSVIGRDSCSGFSEGAVSGEHLGWNVRFYYDMDKVDFASVPPVYAPTTIYVWHPSCPDPFGKGEDAKTPCEILESLR